MAHDLPPVTRRLPAPSDLMAGYVHDTYCRVRTMQGWYVPRPWIRCHHGIPVELEAERRLGISGPEAIEAHGIDAFVTECAGVAYDSSVWWAFETLHEKGLVNEGTGT